LTEVKRGKKALDRVGGGDTMRASAGAGNKESYEGGSSRTRVDFERGAR
jgi:SNW domain-containing protein 1